jgi:hypothetical protein
MRIVVTFFGLLASLATTWAQDLPHYDVAAYCRQVSDVSGGSAMIYNGCIEMEQDAYNKRKADWPSLSPKTRDYCDEVGRVSGGSYSILDGCIDLEVGAAGSTPAFKY